MLYNKKKSTFDASSFVRYKAISYHNIDISIEPIRIQGKAFNVYLSTGKCVPQSDECPGDGKGRRVFQ